MGEMEDYVCGRLSTEHSAVALFSVISSGIAATECTLVKWCWTFPWVITQTHCLGERSSFLIRSRFVTILNRQCTFFVPLLQPHAHVHMDEDRIWFLSAYYPPILQQRECLVSSEQCHRVSYLPCCTHVYTSTRFVDLWWIRFSPEECDRASWSSPSPPPAELPRPQGLGSRTPLGCCCCWQWLYIIFRQRDQCF